MLTFADFSSKIILDFNKTFPKARLQGKYVVVESEPSSVSIPVINIYREYQEIKDYGKTLVSYIRIINDILSQYKFKIDYNNVYPLLKSRDFGKGEKDLGFYREQAFADIDIFYASDVGEVFRFILNSDDVDFDKMKKAAWENLNKLSNILVQLDDALNLFCLRYTTDYNASFLLSDSMQKQIIKKVGQDYFFAIPSSTTLIIAKFRPEYISILKSLMTIDSDPNKISNKVYRCKNGIFNIASD
ncbi:MAG: hypothetical protein PWQ70_2721 [Clostridiales bacterium]|jgi:uncharacterized protein YtpQ (UPF0354 family)|nr:hypothetical protein [Clostridiales bacterium]